MPRKTIDDLFTPEAQALAEFKGDLASEVFRVQDEETKVLIEKIKQELRKHNKTGMPEPWLTHSLNWLAIEIVKDLALVGIRVGNFVFPEGVCAVCGGEAE